MNIADLLELPCLITPDAEAVVDDETSTDYAGLRAASARVAGLLAARNVVSGDRIGICATNRIGVLEAVFGAAAVGATAVVLNFRAGRDEAAHVMEDAGISLMFSEARYRPLIEAVGPRSLKDALWFDDRTYDAAKAAAPDHLEIAAVEPDQTAVMLYTSGTTSMPKGVKLTHGALTRYVMDANDAPDGSDRGRSLVAAPLYHVAGLSSVLNALYTGRVTVMISQFAASAWLSAAARHRITHAFLVPTMLSRVLAAPEFETTDLGALQHLTYGAAPMPLPVIQRALAALPDVAFSGSYGQTETTATLCVLGPEDHRPTGTADAVQRLSSVGRPLPGVALLICDPETGAELPPDHAGEVLVRTDRAMAGYNHDESGRVAVDDDGWLHTGDLGYLDADGYLFLTGRAGDMIIRGGENVAPEEVEKVLYEHRDVHEAAVVGIPDQEWGERIGACVVLREGATTDAEDLRLHCQTRLAPSKRPDVISLLAALPHTATGKIRRRDLRPLVLE